MTSHEFVQPATKLSIFHLFSQFDACVGRKQFQVLDFDETTIHYFHFSNFKTNLFSVYFKLTVTTDPPFLAVRSTAKSLAPAASLLLSNFFPTLAPSTTCAAYVMWTLLE